MNRRVLTPLGLLLLAAAVVLPTAEQGAPAAEARFAARDAHQGVTISARLLADLAEAEERFGKNAAPMRAGLVAVEMEVENERAGPIDVNLGRIALLRPGERFAAVRPEEAALILYPLPEAQPPVLGPQRLPVPTGPRPAKDKHRARREEAQAALASREFRARNVPPGGRARGFLYFYLREVDTELAGAQLYIPEVNDAGTGEGLLFFEIALAPREQPRANAPERPRGL